MARILFLEVDPEDAHLVRERFPDATIVEKVPSDTALVDACNGAEIISCFIHTLFSKDIIAKLPKLKVLCTRSVGFDHIDTEACAKRQIVVCNVPDYGSHVIAEHVFALLLSTVRHVPEGHEKVMGGMFDYHGLRGMALRGKTIGIVGTGKIGRRVAEIAHGFGMNILAADKCRTLELVDAFGVRYVALEILLRASDIITLHVPDTNETKHMINASAFAAMKDGAILVNTARGSLIDSSALLVALRSGKLRYALLDVLEHEQNFEENSELIAHPRVITTPHIAFYADDSMKSMYADSFGSIEDWMNGKEPQHVARPLRILCDLD